MNRIGLVLFMSLIGLPILSAQEKPASDARHQRMLALAKSYALKGPTGEIKLNETPLFSWATPEREAIGGELYLWTLAGRPLATIGIWTYDDIKDSHELQSLATEGLTGARDGTVVWATRVGGLKFRKLDTPTAPDSSSVRRKTQMRTLLAQRFTAELTARDTSSISQLRLLPQPLYRYDPLPAGVLDGAIYSFAYGTDPEVLVLLEARQEPDGSNAWYYAFAPATSSSVRGFIDAKEVWDNSDQETNGTFAFFYNR